MIGIVDYGVGNVEAFINIYQVLNIPTTRVIKPEDFSYIDRIILPGVGAFDYAMQKLDNSGLRESLESLVHIKKMPLLGICVGMQMLAESSDEGNHSGLGFIPGKVRSIKSANEGRALPIPHMGWNQLEIVNPSRFFNRFDDVSLRSFYFLHSYFFEPKNHDTILASAKYGIDIPALIALDNVYGMQCHPEKSHSAGMNFLKIFSEL